jgi:hypothetical protein
MTLTFLRKFAFIHRSNNHLHCFSACYTLVCIFESFSLHVIFEWAIASSREKFVNRIRTQFILDDTI